MKPAICSWENGEQLPVWEKNGQSLDDDMIHLTTLSVSRLGSP